MAVAEGSVVLRGRRVAVREGDLILSDDASLVSRVLSFFNSGWSHVASVIAYEGRLRAFSCVMPPEGLMIEDIERYDSDQYTRLAIVRPYPPRTVAQTMRYRRAVEDVLRAHADRPHEAYDPGLMECFHALFRWQPYTDDKYICTELCARLAKAAGAWPEHWSVSVKIDDLARIVGRVENVY